MKLENFFSNLLNLISYNEDAKIVIESQELIDDLMTGITDTETGNEVSLYKEQMYYLQAIQKAALEKLNRK